MHPRMIKKSISYKKNAPQARFFVVEQNAQQARLIKKKGTKAPFFD